MKADQYRGRATAALGEGGRRLWKTRPTATSTPRLHGQEVSSAGEVVSIGYLLGGLHSLTACKKPPRRQMETHGADDNCIGVSTWYGDFGRWR